MSSSISSMIGVAAGLALAGTLVACVRPPPPAPSGAEKRTEITLLWAKIRDWRREAKMELDPTPQSLFAVKKMSVPEAKRVCPDGHEVPKTCSDVCDLADAICDNAEAICTIAAELGPQDTFAQEKCTSAKASCHESKQRCCDCSGDK
ncbi:MAG: hypothetical protein H0T79_03355 [Deltaproteobacteria bacterium]|nr:hypothetical protein [Deltaproteobacteria bacterium]